MADGLRWLLIGAVGLVLGLIYFGGLWLTVRRLPTSRKPARLLLGSWLARMGLTLGVFYVVLRGGVEQLLIALLGFLLARLIVWRWVRGNTPQPGIAGEKVP